MIVKRALPDIVSDTFIDIVYADYDIAKYLSVPKVHPLISLVGVPVDQDGHPIHISEQLIVSGRMRFIV